MTSTTAATGRGGPFADELRRWRQLRRVSQLDLALRAHVSQRHISFLETGRSEPSREMVVQLAEALDVPLRDRNTLLTAAGYAPLYGQRGLDDAELSQLMRVLDTVVRAYDPFPAYVVDRAWNLVLANATASALTSRVTDPTAAATAAGGNVLRLLLHPNGLRPMVTNWEHVAAVMLRRLEREVADAPTDERLGALLTDLRGLPDVGGIRPSAAPPNPDELLVPLQLDLDGVQLRLFTTIATIGAPYDVTVAELRIESLLPADDESDQALRSLLEP